MSYCKGRPQESDIPREGMLSFPMPGSSILVQLRATHKIGTRSTNPYFAFSKVGKRKASSIEGSRPVSQIRNKAKVQLW